MRLTAVRRPRRATRLGPWIAAAVCAAALAADQEPTFFNDARAKELFTAGRIAIYGGPNGAARLKSLALEGRSRIPSAEGALVDGAVDIRILLPDRYIRIDSGSYGRRITGYAGNASLDVIETDQKRTMRDPADAAAVLQGNRRTLARLMLGLAMYASQEVPVNLQTRGTWSEMPGTSDPLGIDVVGDNGFNVRLVLDPKSRLPARLIFWDTDRTVLTTAFQDRKAVGGVKLPYHIVTTAGDRIVDDLSFDEIRVNPPLSKTDFASS